MELLVITGGKGGHGCGKHHDDEQIDEISGKTLQHLEQCLWATSSAPECEQTSAPRKYDPPQ